MAEIEKEIEKVINELRSDKERKFVQTVDLIVNLQKFDVKKDLVNVFTQLPHKIKDKKICAFLTSKNKGVDTVTDVEFKKYSDKKELKKLERNYDFFIAQASLMPKVATTFGRVLGPAGKMPSPQMGIIPEADDKLISELKERINQNVRIRSKEASIKLGIGKQNMKEADLTENAVAVYNALLKALPRGIDNIKNVELKLTMGKPHKISIK